MFCFRNAAENTWIYNQYGGQYGWIGYTDMPPYGGGKGTKQYGWITGCTSTYTNWDETQPDNHEGKQDYAYFRGNGKWDDGNAESAIYCGCQFNPALTTTPSFSPSVGDISE
jgi:hypothetical protein